MRNGLLLNGLIGGLAMVLSLASPWATAANADVAQVTVVSPGGAQHALSLEALAGSEDVLNRSYAVRSASGESAQVVTGFSLAAILDAAGADPYGFSYLEVQRPAGGAVQLSRDQALDADAFADGPPAVYATASGTGFLRPSAGPEDLNATDCFDAPQGIVVVLHKGSRLQIHAKASTQRTRPGRPVHFSATVDRAGSGEQLTYSWYFDDGGSATSAEATHSFAKPGSYDVVLGVTSAGDDTGASAVVTVQVGAPIAGPDRKGGGRSDAPGAPDHGVATPPGPGDGATTGSLPAGAPRRTERSPDPGQQVVGELVSATTEPRAPAAKQAAARSGQLDGDGGGGVPGAAWGVLATLGLLGAGALAEAGGLARLWPRGAA